MVQVVDQTKEKKIAMYMKCTKKQLAEMLYNANVLLDRPPVIYYQEQPCDHVYPAVWHSILPPTCLKCGR
jgi:hypothetical protein